MPPHLFMELPSNSVFYRLHLCLHCCNVFVVYVRRNHLHVLGGGGPPQQQEGQVQHRQEVPLCGLPHSQPVCGFPYSVPTSGAHDCGYQDCIADGL